jgi:hypothetical protein
MSGEVAGGLKLSWSTARRMDRRTFVQLFAVLCSADSVPICELPGIKAPIIAPELDSIRCAYCRNTSSSDGSSIRVGAFDLLCADCEWMLASPE